jgi:nucleoside-diphosphate-sugar epimerase
MRVFITGATGLIGRGVVSALEAAGHEAVGLTNHDQNRSILERLGATAVVGDMGDGATWDAHARAADAIIHCAKPTARRLGEKQAQEWAAADLACLDHLLKAARDGCKPLIYTSGAWVYGPGTERRTENAPVAPFPHIAHKIDGEEKVLTATFSNDVKGVVLRPGMVYAPLGQFSDQYLRVMEKGHAARYAGNGSNLQSWVHVDDLSQAFVQAIEKPPVGQIFNVADDEPVSIATLLGELAATFGAKQPSGSPAFIIKLLLGRSLGTALMAAAVCSNDAMKSTLGVQLKYPTFREGARDIARVHRAAGDTRLAEAGA